MKLYEEIGTEVFGNSRVVEVLGCSEVTATAYLKRMEDELKIIVSIGVVLTSFTKGKAQPQNTAFVINKAGNMVIVWFNKVHQNHPLYILLKEVFSSLSLFILHSQ